MGNGPSSNKPASNRKPNQTNVVWRSVVLIPLATRAIFWIILEFGVYFFLEERRIGVAEKNAQSREQRAEKQKPTILISNNKWTPTNKPVVFRVIN